MMADSARNMNAKKDIVMVAAEASVNASATFSFIILSVIGTAVDADDIKRYAITWNKKENN